MSEELTACSGCGVEFRDGQRYAFVRTRPKVSAELAFKGLQGKLIDNEDGSYGVALGSCCRHLQARFSGLVQFLTHQGGSGTPAVVSP